MMDSTANRRPNVVLIVVDCLRADRCPVQGAVAGPLVTWPALRARGAVFTQMISTASITPVCFASLLTGLYSFAHGVRTIAGPRLKDEVPTLATLLKGQGYRTFAYATGPLLPAFGLDRDFDVYQHRTSDQTIYGPWGRDFLATFVDRHFAGEQQSGQPAFVMLHLYEIHNPPALNGRTAPRQSILEYDLAWEELDKRLAELVAKLPADTLVVLTADHGDQIGRRSDRTWWGHMVRKLRSNFRRPRRVADCKGHGFQVYEDLIRVPCVFAGPGVPAGLVRDDLVRQVDIAATVADLVGLPCPPMHGRSLVPLLRGQSPPAEPALVESGGREPNLCWQGLRTETWKYAEKLAEGPSRPKGEGLFDFAADPLERRNQIARHRDIADQLRAEMQRILQSNPLAGATARPMTSAEQEQLAEHLKALGYL